MQHPFLRPIFFATPLFLPSAKARYDGGILIDPNPKIRLKSLNLYVRRSLFGGGIPVLRFAGARALALENQKCPSGRRAGYVKGKPRAEGLHRDEVHPGMGGA